MTTERPPIPSAAHRIRRLGPVDPFGTGSSLRQLLAMAWRHIVVALVCVIGANAVVMSVVARRGSTVAVYTSVDLEYPWASDGRRAAINAERLATAGVITDEIKARYPAAAEVQATRSEGDTLYIIGVAEWPDIALGTADVAQQVFLNYLREARTAALERHQRETAGVQADFRTRIANLETALRAATDPVERQSIETELLATRVASRTYQNRLYGSDWSGPT